MKKFQDEFQHTDSCECVMVSWLAGSIY